MTTPQTVTGDRTRTIDWHDPLAGAAIGATMSGLDYMRAMMAGEVPPPPIAVLLGMDVVSVEHGEATFTVDPAEFHYNPIGLVHGGVTSTLLDSVMGCAVHSTLPAGVGYATTDLTVHFVRPVSAGSGLVTATGRVVHAGRRTALAEATAHDGSGRLVAHATSGCAILRP